MNQAHVSGRAAEQPHAPRRQMRLLALLFGLGLALVVFEISLRMMPQAISPRLLILFEPGLRADVASGAYPLQKDFLRIERDDGGPPLFVAKPDTLIVSIDEVPGGAERRTDEIGFCNPPGRYAGRERIDLLALGDSFTWCHAVVPEQAWPALLGERTGLTAFSLGRGGNGPYEYLQYLRAFGLAKRPRIVVMNIYGGNDLRDAVSYRDYRAAVAKGEEPPSEAPAQVAPWLVSSAIGRHSYALNFVLALVSRVAGQGAGDWERTGINFRYELALPAGAVEFNTENRDRDEVVSARHLEEGATPLAIWDDALRRFAELGREHGFAAVVAYTPSAHAAYSDRVRLADASLAPLLARFDEAQRRHLRERAAADGFLFHDLTADLRRAAASGEDLLYDPVHVHLTAHGNQAVAASLARFLAEHDLATGTPR